MQIPFEGIDDVILQKTLVQLCGDNGRTETWGQQFMRKQDVRFTSRNCNGWWMTDRNTNVDKRP
jgi:hypothetical protein